MSDDKHQNNMFFISELIGPLPQMPQALYDILVGLQIKVNPHPIWMPLLLCSLIHFTPKHWLICTWKSIRLPRRSSRSITAASSPSGLRRHETDMQEDPRATKPRMAEEHLLFIRKNIVPMLAFFSFQQTFLEHKGDCLDRHVGQ